MNQIRRFILIGIGCTLLVSQFSTAATSVYQTKVLIKNPPIIREIPYRKDVLNRDRICQLAEKTCTQELKQQKTRGGQVYLESLILSTIEKQYKYTHGTSGYPRQQPVWVVLFKANKRVLYGADPSLSKLVKIVYVFTVDGRKLITEGIWYESFTEEELRQYRQLHLNHT